MKNILWLIILAIGAGLIVFSFLKKQSGLEEIGKVSQNQPSVSPVVSLTPLPKSSGKPQVAKIPLPTGDGKTTFIDETVPWHLLLSDASCELKGEIKFLNANTYDNQDAVFIYSGIDHPARNIKWTVVPDDGSFIVGPNLFSKIQLPYGQALLGIFPRQEPKNKKYELTATIAYGRLVDEKGNFVTAGGTVKLFEKQCKGKTTVVLP